jgi:SAM-dependent methyltransferase
MPEYTPSTYGDTIADVYDVVSPHADPAAIDMLAGLAGEGPVLELGIGTGRLALPLAARGVAVHGIDASPAMVEQLRRKPGGSAIRVTVGDFADFSAGGQYSLVFVAFNTIFALQTQDEQVRCFERVAAALRPGGAFLVEAFVPDPGRFDRGQRIGVTRFEDDGVWLEASQHHAPSQVVDARLVRLSKGGLEFFPIRIRYAWPSELDLMARLAGLRLRDRWGGWQQQPYTSESTAHVSVYERAD